MLVLGTITYRETLILVGYIVFILTISSVGYRGTLILEGYNLLHDFGHDNGHCRTLNMLIVKPRYTKSKFLIFPCGRGPSDLVKMLIYHPYSVYICG